MKRSLVVACLTFTTIVLAITVVRPISADRRGPDNAVASAAGFAPAVATLQNKGRYKKQGDECVWDANDGGPNQCTPVTRGRFKRGGDDSCTWDSNDSGPDQCKPRAGRWKKGDGDRCYWDAKDSGPNQCNPRQARR
jgi:hypothetical protein